MIATVFLFNANSPWTVFWGSTGSCLGMFLGIAVYVWHHNCHQHRCWRIGRIKRDGKPICHKHHRCSTLVTSTDAES